MPTPVIDYNKSHARRQSATSSLNPPHTYPSYNSYTSYPRAPATATATSSSSASSPYYVSTQQQKRNRSLRRGLCVVVAVSALILLAAISLVAFSIYKIRDAQSRSLSTSQLNVDANGKTPTSSSSASSTPTPTAVVADPSVPFTGRCGVQGMGAICPTTSTTLTKGHYPCCGPDGYCGSSYFSCGSGCQSGCDSFTPASDLTGLGTFVEAGRTGVPAMHSILVPRTGNVVFLDKQETSTQLNLTGVDARRFAYSAEYNPTTLALTPLDMRTNAFCSAVGTMANGTLFSVGGSLNYDDPRIASGYTAIRLLNRPCTAAATATTTGPGVCDWQEWPNITARNLQGPRWYPTAVPLADGRIFIIGGISVFDQGVAISKANNNPTYEYYPRSPPSTPATPSVFKLDLLESPTVEPFQMYPHVHVLRSGRLFVLAGRSAVVLDTTTNTVVKTVPDLPGIYPRTYPSVGAGTMLPLSPSDNYTVHFMVCGGGHPDLWIEQPATGACGIITPEAESPTWDLSESLPQARLMVHPEILPDGTILFINGASKGHQGWEAAKDPVMAPDLFVPNAPSGKRWYTLAQSPIARMYHSVSQLMPDGRVLVAGSNAHLNPNFTDPYPTEYRIEMFTPPYLLTGKTRPTFTTDPPTSVLPGDTLNITATYDSTLSLQATFYFPGGVTHSMHMGTRMVFAPTVSLSGGTGGTGQLQVTVPPDNNVVPPGWYVVYLVNGGVPSVGKWVQVGIKGRT